MKVYDAREDGGFLFDPPPHPCAASDECHGAGTQAPAPPNINTFTGAGHGAEAQPPSDQLQEGLRQEARQVREEEAEETPPAQASQRHG